MSQQEGESWMQTLHTDEIYNREEACWARHIWYNILTGFKKVKVMIGDYNYLFKGL